MTAGEYVDISGFATIIQLWAAICVLCFYDKLLKNWTKSKRRSHFCDILTDLQNKFADVLSKSDAQAINAMISSYENFDKSVKYVGKLSFCYCMLLLVVIALNTSMHKDLTANSGILMSLTAFMTCAWFSIAKMSRKAHDRPWSFLKSALGILVVFVLFAIWPIPEFQSISVLWIMLISVILLTAIIPLLYVYQYQLDVWFFGSGTKAIDKVKEYFDIYARLLIMPMSADGNQDVQELPADLREIVLDDKRDPKEAKKWFSRNVLQIINRHRSLCYNRYLLNTFGSSIYRFLASPDLGSRNDPRCRCKNSFRQFLCDTAFTTSFILIILFYLVIEFSLFLNSVG